MWKINAFNLSLLRHFLWFAVALFVFSSCTDDEEYTIGVWEQRSDLDGKARSGAVSFTIGNKGYVCAGYTTKDARLKDLWVYDIEGDYWTQLADMPEEAEGRNAAVGFSIGHKGYISTGTPDGKTHVLADTWEYDTTSNTWLQKDDYPGGGRVYAVGFGIGNYGYVGTGDDLDGNVYKDFYRLDPEAPAGSQWEIVNGFGGTKRKGATVFIIDDIAYLCTGASNNIAVYDFWKFNPAASPQWEKLRDTANTDSDEDYDDEYGAIGRVYAVSFVIDGRGFLVTGSTSSSANKTDYWIYDPETDLWDNEDLTPFYASERSARNYAVSFSTGTRGFVTTGGSGSYRLDDTWELLPYELED